MLYDPEECCLEEVLAQVRDGVAMLDIAHEASPVSERVTVSIGAGVSPSGGLHSAQSLLELADEALQDVKRRGRNGMAIKNSIGPGAQGRVFKGPWKSSP